MLQCKEKRMLLSTVTGIIYSPWDRRCTNDFSCCDELGSLHFVANKGAVVFHFMLS